MPVNYFFRHEVAEKVREEGHEAGREVGREEGIEAERAAMVLRILEWRGMSVSESVRDRVTGCSDLERLAVWAQRAIQASAVEDVFADDSGTLGG